MYVKCILKIQLFFQKALETLAEGLNSLRNGSAMETEENPAGGSGTGSGTGTGSGSGSVPRNPKSRRLYVSAIPNGTTLATMTEYFSKFGPVIEVSNQIIQSVCPLLIIFE